MIFIIGFYSYSKWYLDHHNLIEGWYILHRRQLNKAPWVSQESQTLYISLQYIMMDSSGFIKILTFWCACLPLLMAESARMHPWLWSVWTAGILRPFQLHFQAFHADLEAVHGLNGSLSAGGVIEAHKACRRERNWVCCSCVRILQSL